MKELRVKWQSPSNIALVKYWGKHGVQLPANPSISFSLSESRSETSVTICPRGGGERFRFRFEGESKPSFMPKIEQFFERVTHLFPFIEDHSFEIDSMNTFPHSSGIASSASSMSALAICLCDIESQIEGRPIDMQKASIAARLGSGSACRSVFGGFALWGDTPDFERSNDEFAVRVPEVHSDFMTLQDSILLIDEGVKPVSSTVGHGLMVGHSFAQSRFEQARANIARILPVLKTGDFMTLADIVEQEALSLHAMMMTSDTPYILFRPGTIEVISRIMDRRRTGEPISFTLDAGANVHVIYPETYVDKAQQFIEEELLVFCANGQYICDKVGTGPQTVVPSQ